LPPKKNIRKSGNTKNIRTAVELKKKIKETTADNFFFASALINFLKICVKIVVYLQEFWQQLWSLLYLLVVYAANFSTENASNHHSSEGTGPYTVTDASSSSSS